jgi:beta-glucanase (GH16 family)
MNRMYFSFLILALTWFTTCSGDSDESSLVLPSDLVVDVDVSDDGSGNVSVEATAVNANFFTVYFGEDSNETPVKTNNGKATHKYLSSGDYTIRVQANATSAKFIEEEIDITIDLDGETEITIPATGYTTPTSYAGMTLVWEENFTGTSLSTTNWTFEAGRGTNGWGNNELQYYKQDNTQLLDGHLVITAKKEAFGGAEYTSSRIVTRDKKAFQYGRIDIRAVLPKGQGIWPALWMLGSNFPTIGWPASGEIDIMEMVGGGGKEKTVHGTLHWDNAGSYACTCGHAGYSLSSGTFNDEFHVFSIVWNTNSITWYVDDIQFQHIDTTPANLSEFDAQFFFIVNLAVGGNWPGSPDASTVFPQHLIVDYIRVFQ